MRVYLKSRKEAGTEKKKKRSAWKIGSFYKFANIHQLRFKEHFGTNLRLKDTAFG